MIEMISQCPKCMTSFRVTEDQLTVAGGKVRCGYCMNVFMGHDYLISGGEQGQGMADEDVLRSLLDGGEISDSDGFDPPLASGIEKNQFFDLEGSLSGTDDETDPDPVSFDDVSLYDGPLAVDAESDIEKAVSVDDLDLGAEPELRDDDGAEPAESAAVPQNGLSGHSSEEVFGEPEETLEEGSGVPDMAEADKMSPEGEISTHEAVIVSGSTPAVGDDLIEPDLSLIEETLKFDEDDLRNSTDEDWALELLAELEGTGKYKDSTEASDAYVKELLADADSALPKTSDLTASETKSSGSQSHRSGLGFEEIIVDAVPPSDQGADKYSEFAQQDSLGAQAEASGQPSAAAVDSEGQASGQEFSQEFNNANAAPALGQSAAPDVGNVATETGSLASREAELGVQETSSDIDLYEDASSVYQLSTAGDAEPESSVSAEAIDALIGDADDEPKRRKTDFLPHDIDIASAPVGTVTSSNFIEWKWIAGSLGMLMLMLVQYSYFYWDDLTASAKTRPMFASMCNVLGCELPPYRNLRSVKTDQLSVRSHPDSETALIVDIILTNKAQLAQPFPVLQLTFFDIRSQPVATRKFFPNEYLDGELRGLSSMPSDNPIRLALEIMDPGAEAINYELNLLPTL